MKVAAFSKNRKPVSGGVTRELLEKLATLGVFKPGRALKLHS